MAEASNTETSSPKPRRAPSISELEIEAASYLVSRVDMYKKDDWDAIVKTFSVATIVAPKEAATENKGK